MAATMGNLPFLNNALGSLWGYSGQAVQLTSAAATGLYEGISISDMMLRPGMQEIENQSARLTDFQKAYIFGHASGVVARFATKIPSHLVSWARS